MERKIARMVICAAAVLVGVLTLYAHGMNEVVVRRTLTAEQAMRECSGLIISQKEQDAFEQIWVDQLFYVPYERRELDAETCDVLGVPGGEAYAQIAPSGEGTESDFLYIDCWTASGGRVIYEITKESCNKTVAPSGRDVTYLNWNNTSYEKYTSHVLWPWTDF